MLYDSEERHSLSETPLRMTPDTDIPVRNLRVQYTKYDGESAVNVPKTASWKYDQTRIGFRPNLHENINTQ